MQDPVDLARFVEFSDGTPSGLTALVDLFVSDAGDTFDELVRAIASGRARDVELLAHRGAGASASCGARQLGALLARLEGLGREGSLDDAAHVLAQVETELARVTIFLRTQKASHEPDARARGGVEGCTADMKTSQTPVLRDEEFEHTLRNQIAIIIGYCELLLHTADAGSELRQDIAEMEKAARTAMAMLRDGRPTIAGL